MILTQHFYVQSQHRVWLTYTSELIIFTLSSFLVECCFTSTETVAAGLDLYGERSLNIISQSITGRFVLHDHHDGDLQARMKQQAAGQLFPAGCGVEVVDDSHGDHILYYHQNGPQTCGHKIWNENTWKINSVKGRNCSWNDFMWLKITWSALCE